MQQGKGRATSCSGSLHSHHWAEARAEISPRNEKQKHKRPKLEEKPKKCKGVVEWRELSLKETIDWLSRRNPSERPRHWMGNW